MQSGLQMTQGILGVGEEEFPAGQPYRKGTQGSHDDNR